VAVFQLLSLDPRWEGEGKEQGDRDLMRVGLWPQLASNNLPEGRSARCFPTARNAPCKRVFFSRIWAKSQTFET